MTIDKAKLKELAEKACPIGEWYSSGDLRYADDKAGEIHGLHHDDDSFIAAASPATVLALLAEIEQLQAQVRLAGVTGEMAVHDAVGRAATEHVSAIFERDQLKAENEALRNAMREISEQVDGNIRCAVRDVVNCRGDVQDIYGYCDTIDEIIDAAVAKEASHG